MANDKYHRQLAVVDIFAGQIDLYFFGSRRIVFYFFLNGLGKKRIPLQIIFGLIFCNDIEPRRWIFGQPF
jgi:hypothetical protein